VKPRKELPYRVRIALLEIRAWLQLARTALPELTLREFTAVACLASLFVRSERYPVIVEVTSAAIRLQDVLFAALLVVSSAAVAAWVREQPLVAGSLATFLTLLLLAALRSPVGTTAVIGAGRYVEFVIVGVAIALGLRSARPSVTTGVLAVGTTVLAATATGDLIVQAGLSNLVHGRSGGTLPIETAAAAASFALVGCMVRLQRLESPGERVLAIGAIIAAVVVLAAAKSLLAIGCALAVLALLPLLSSRRLFFAFAVAAAILAVFAVGRSSDIGSALQDGAGAAQSAPPHPAPSSDASVRLPASYVRRTPSDPKGGSFVHRIALAYLGVRIAQDAPPFGYGWLATSDSGFLRNGPYDLYMLERFPQLEPALLVSNLPTGSHNAYLQTAAEVGLVATALLIGVLLLVLIPGLVVVHRHRTVAPWLAACGVGWLVVVITFLFSSTLFGGQLETAMLGVALALGGVPSRERVGPWRWMLAAFVVAASVIPALVLLMLTPPRPDAPALSRAVADAAGRELLREGPLEASIGSVELRNGLIRARVRGERVELLATSAVGSRFGSAKAYARLSALGRARTVRLTKRTADVVTLDFISGEGTSVAALTIVRGVAGVYLNQAPASQVTLSSMDALATGQTLRRAILNLRDVAPRGLRPGTPTVSIRQGSRGLAAVVVPLTPTVVDAQGGNVRFSTRQRGRSFVGIYPFPTGSSGSAPVGPLAAGTFLAATGERGGTMRLLRSGGGRPPWADQVSVLVPFALDDPPRSGVAELASVAVAYRDAPPQDLP